MPQSRQQHRRPFGLYGQDRQISSLLNRVVVVALQAGSVDNHGYDAGYKRDIGCAESVHAGCPYSAQAQIAARLIVQAQKFGIPIRWRKGWVAFVEGDR